MSTGSKPLVWLKGRLRTPPLSRAARLEAGYLLRLLQQGTCLTLPKSRPMPVPSRNCHELRIQDQDKIWRILYRLDRDAVVLLEVFCKKSRETPEHIIQDARRRLAGYDLVVGE